MRGKSLLFMFLFLLISPGGLSAQDAEEENLHVEMLKDRLICLDCHTRLPEEGETSPDYFLVDLPSENCLGCHSEVEHTGVKEHERQDAKPLPGDENGKIACFTCHDPHPFGAIAGRVVYEADVDSRNRAFVGIILIPDMEERLKMEVSSAAKPEVYLKLPVKGDKICVACHETLKEPRWRSIVWDKFLALFSY